MLISVYGIDSAGNIGESATIPVIGLVPATQFKDGYFTDGANPDLPAVGTGSKPSPLLYTGAGRGTSACD